MHGCFVFLFENDNRLVLSFLFLLSQIDIVVIEFVRHEDQNFALSLLRFIRIL